MTTEAGTIAAEDEELRGVKELIEKHMAFEKTLKAEDQNKEWSPLRWRRKGQLWRRFANAETGWALPSTSSTKPSSG